MKKGLNHPELEAFSGLKPPYTKSKDDVWAELSKAIDKQDAKIHTLRPAYRKNIFRYAVAAIIAIMIGLPAFMRFYTVKIYSEYGEHAEVLFPDDSKVNLNADTRLSYHPYWWKFSREVKMEGEAYFEVTKGNSFTVKSNMGETTVLGTSFNIYTRDNSYAVNCLTGSVKVSDYTSDVVIKPNQKAELEKQKGLVVYDNVAAQNAVSWINNEFVYTGTNLSKVINDLELQYNIHISYSKTLRVDTLTYTGSFDRSLSAENVLYFVFKPFGLKTIEKGQGEYEITNEN
ncbi:FecR family protein [Saccharicrinis sp. FJH54]|uniref:FecR family protein n=1 Tax=Saccharicrinis sp. FJH54 TaxID=3344665 RepID=UPI0035D4E55A